MQKAAIYTRVSSLMQLDNFSIAAQLEVCEKLALERGWWVVGHYSDQAKSGKSKNRPAFQQLLEDARNGAIEVIVVHKLDRFTRSLTDLLLTIHELEQIGVSVISATEQFDFTSPIGKLVLAVLGAIAQWYLDNLSQETSKGHRARAMAGHYLGMLPYGYWVEHKGKGGDGLARVDDEQASGVRIAYDAYVTGEYSNADVASLLNSKGYRPAGRNGARSLSQWSKDSVSVLLQNRFYTGQVQYKGEWFDGLHEPIISTCLFESVQAVRVKRRRSKRKISNKHKDGLYLCSGIARCAHCGNTKRVTSWYNRHNNNRRYYYSCDPKSRQHKCNAPCTRIEVAEETLKNYLCNLKLPGDWEKRIAQSQEGSKYVLLKKREDLRATLERLKKLFLLGDITEKEYITTRDEVKKELAELALPTISNKQANLQEAHDLLSSFSERWEKAKNQKERQKLVRALVDEVWLNEGGIVKITPKAGLETLFDIAT